MKLETFFEKFELFADAPGAVGKLRELVLELAVRGKLVVQNITDEPAAQLLKRVLVEKNRRTGRSERFGEEQGLPRDDEAFEIPVNWEWIGATTPAVMVSDQGKKVQTKDILESGKYPVVDQGKMFIRGYCDDSDKVISVAEPIVLFGDHTRETKFIDFDFVVGADGVKLLQPICIDPQFYFLVLRWLPLESRGYARHFKLLKAARIPLPPLVEQKRIVAKVDELMAVCDRLEAQLCERQTQYAMLARAALTRFAGAPTPANLELLFHESFDIAPADLRKSILTLAVQGELTRGWRETENLPDLQSVQLCEVAEGFSYGSAAKSQKKGAVPVLRMGNIQEGKLDWADLVFTSDTAEIAKYRLEPGDVLFNRTNSPALVGKTALYDGSREAIYAGYLIKVRCKPQLLPAFLTYCLNSPMGRAYSWQVKTDGVSQSNINAKKLAAFRFDLPSLEEQHRIVAKVDELMTLVDALESQLATARENAATLLAAVVAELTNGTECHAVA